MRRLIMGNVSVTNELSSRPERSVVEGPAVKRFVRLNQEESQFTPLIKSLIWVISPAGCIND